jgi:hypothetical protein
MLPAWRSLSILYLVRIKWCIVSNVVELKTEDDQVEIGEIFISEWMERLNLRVGLRLPDHSSNAIHKSQQKLTNVPPASPTKSPEDIHLTHQKDIVTSLGGVATTTYQTIHQRDS